MRCIWCQEKIHIFLNWSILFSKKIIGQSAICQKCRQLWTPLTGGRICSGCSRPLDIDIDGDCCSDCERWLKVMPKDWVNHRALLSYDEFGREYMKRLKYLGDTDVAIMMAPLLRDALQAEMKNGWLIVPIPSSDQTLLERGFNQVDCLLDYAEIPYQHFLANISTGKRQAEKNRQERLLSQRNFRLVVEKETLTGKKIVIVDDVYTTGRTIFHAKEALQHADSVRSLSLFR